MTALLRQPATITEANIGFPSLPPCGGGPGRGDSAKARSACSSPLRTYGPPAPQGGRRNAKVGLRIAGVAGVIGRNCLSKTRPTTSRRGEAGFTLVEVLVAVAITAIMLGTVATALRTLSGAAAIGARDADRIDMVSRGLAAVRNDLTRIERVVRKEKQSVRFEFSGDRRTLSFVVIEPPFPSDPGSYLVSYRVRQFGDNRAQLVRSREPYDPEQRRKARDRDEAAEVVVLEGAYRFEFSFFGRTTQAARWQQSWQATNFMPQLIRLEMASLVANVPSLPPLIVRLRIDAEASCLAGPSEPCSPRTGALVAGPGGAAAGAGSHQWQAVPK